jgi:serine/threonine protein kinase
MFLHVCRAASDTLLALSMSSDNLSPMSSGDTPAHSSLSTAVVPTVPTLSSAEPAASTGVVLSPLSASIAGVSTLQPEQLTGSAHVVKFYDAFADTEAGRVGIVMEYMGGGSLEDLVKAGGCQDEGNLANMSAQILKVALLA